MDTDTPKNLYNHSRKGTNLGGEGNESFLPPASREQPLPLLCIYYFSKVKTHLELAFLSVLVAAHW